MANYNPKVISELPRFDRAKLQDMWKELFNGPAPPKLRREWLVRILAYRIQERAYGGLKPETQRRLLEFGRLLERNPNASLPDLPACNPGTQFVREWKGQSHIVTTVKEGGYEYRHKHFNSLSEVAREITGTRWSGPLFFGLKKKFRGATN